MVDADVGGIQFKAACTCQRGVRTKDLKLWMSRPSVPAAAMVKGVSLVVVAVDMTCGWSRREGMRTPKNGGNNPKMAANGNDVQDHTANFFARANDIDPNTQFWVAELEYATSKVARDNFSHKIIITRQNSNFYAYQGLVCWKHDSVHTIKQIVRM